MFLFGHLGIGLSIVRPWSRGLSRRLILLGTILPDLIDKPIYYGLSWFNGKSGADLGMLAGTRLFGHTGLFLLTCTVAATIRRSRALAALSLGIATHLLLDNLTDRIVVPERASLNPLAWPLLGWQFPSYPYRSAHDHLLNAATPFIFWSEVVGLLLLGWIFWKKRNRESVVESFKAMRSRHFRRRK